MHKILACLLMVALLSVFSCSNQQVERSILNGVEYVENPNKGLLHNKVWGGSVTFTHEISIGENDSVLFSNITDVFTDDYCNVYIFDSKSCQLYSYDSLACFRWVVGRRGRGPNEFNNVQGCATNGNSQIFVLNEHGRRIDSFDLNGKYLKSYNLSGLNLRYAKLEGFTNDDRFIVSKNIMGHCGLQIFALKLNDNEDLEITNSLRVTEPIDVRIPMGLSWGPSVGVFDNVYLSLSNKYELQVYNSKFQLKSCITRDFNKLMRPGLWESGGSRSIQETSSLSVPYLIKNGNFIVQLSWPVNVADPDEFVIKNIFEKPREIKFRNSLDIYNSRFELLCSVESDGNLPELGKLVHVDHLGKLYTILEEPVPHVRRYDITINY